MRGLLHRTLEMEPKKPEQICKTVRMIHEILHFFTTRVAYGRMLKTNSGKDPAKNFHGEFTEAIAVG